jgi:hypothetical protein
MVVIYCIEDINDLKYVGRTTEPLHIRLSHHRTDKILGRNTSSKHLNLYYCIIYELETCNEEDKREKEKYWIQTIDCVNTRKFQCDDPEYLSNIKNKCNREKQRLMRLNLKN